MRQFLFALILSLLQPTSALAFRILIDPGHGGTDHGATYGAAQESKLVLKVANELKQKLSNDIRFSVEMTRNSDQLIPLSERVKKAEQFSADLFISLHANANPDRKVKGMEVYFQNQMPIEEENLFLANEESQWLPVTTNNEKITPTDLNKSSDINTIIDDLKRQGRIKLSLYFSEILKQNWSGHIRQAPFYVISKTRVPSILIEIGFLSHAQEAEKLISKKTQQELADKIYQSVIKYAETIKSKSTSLSKID